MNIRMFSSLRLLACTPAALAASAADLDLSVEAPLDGSAILEVIDL